jgi:branched-chain amino acid transport system permease protein
MKRHAPAVISLAVVAGVLVLLPFVLSTYNVYLVALVGVFFCAILGLNILTGYTGQISIGHGAFMAIGGYATAILSRDHHMNLVLTMVVAFALCFIAGLLFGLPALRLSGVYLALATFALAVSIPKLPYKWSTYLGGSVGVHTDDIKSNLWIYVAAWSASGVLLLLAWLILRGRLGRAFRAVRDSEIAATASGVETSLYKTLAFGISAAYCGVAGSLWVIALSGYAQPTNFSVGLSLTLLVGAAVAGLGSLWGILAGAAFVGLLPKLSQSVPILGSDHGRDVVYGALVILVMFVAPGGLAGLLARLRSLVRT